MIFLQRDTSITVFNGTKGEINGGYERVWFGGVGTSVHSALALCIVATRYLRRVGH